MRGIERIFGVSRQTLAAWLKKSHHPMEQHPPPIQCALRSEDLVLFEIRLLSRNCHSVIYRQIQLEPVI